MEQLFSGLIAFSAPWLLLAALALPILWFLLRLTPPAPKRQPFPALLLLLGLKSKEETPDKTPWWLLLLRIVLACIIILALAGPILNPNKSLEGSGPLLVVLDDGWSAAPDWDKKMESLSALLRRSARSEREVALVTTAPTLENSRPDIAFLPAETLLQSVNSLRPQAWPNDRKTVAASLLQAQLPEDTQSAIWISDGIGDGEGALVSSLQQKGLDITVYKPALPKLPKLLLPPSRTPTSLEIDVSRPASGYAQILRVEARDKGDIPILTQTLRFAPDEMTAHLSLSLPLTLMNRLSSLAILDENTIGARYLFDSSWQQKLVGVASRQATLSAQPLLDARHYLENALLATAQVTMAELGQLLDQQAHVIVLNDVLPLREADYAKLDSWLEKGGVLLRFAGPRLAVNPDPYLPVTLRGEDRLFGGTLSWDKPAQLADFSQTSPFHGLIVPDDVLISRQILAEPSLDLQNKTWARLSDGTPFITAEPRGKGWVALVHTTAEPGWSNFPLSGLFVEILNRLLLLSSSGAGGAQNAPSGLLKPEIILDGFGRPNAAPPYLLPFKRRVGEDTVKPGPAHPPGIYKTEDISWALNLTGTVTSLPLLDLPANVDTVEPISDSQEIEIGKWLILAAGLIFLADLIISAIMRGLFAPLAAMVGLQNTRKSKTSASGLFWFFFLTALAFSGFATLASPSLAHAQSGVAQTPTDTEAILATRQTRLGYILTGDTKLDQLTRTGLITLSATIASRTSVEPEPPAGLRPGIDELAFYPLIYWAISPTQAAMSPAAIDDLQNFMDNGGTLLIDLRQPVRDFNLFTATAPQIAALRRLTQGLDIPPLMQMPPEHVLGKSFYLLNTFPGRLHGGTLWIERTDPTRNDGVASLLVGSNDYVGAWAKSDPSSAFYPVVPGGEQQREMAYRFGINLIMYVLTGNYKEDQLHAPFILERLGQ